MSKFDSLYEVKQITKKLASEYIIKNHYSHTFPAACVNLAAYEDEKIVAVAVFGKSARPNMAKTIIDFLSEHEYYELQRLHALETPKNFETWFLSKCFDWLKTSRPNIKLLISFADPHYGHSGTIYRASNWIYLGRSASTTTYIDIYGNVVHNRTISKHKVDKTTLKREVRQGKHRYLMFLTKTINAYRNIVDSSIIREEEINYWLEKEKQDGVIYIERYNDYPRKYKINLFNNLKRPIVPFK